MKTEQKARHSPGPWIYGDGSLIWDATGNTSVALIESQGWDEEARSDDGPPHETAIANARLITAAPDTLDALKRAAYALDRLWQQAGPSDQHAIASDLVPIRAAITKATVV